MLPQFNIGDNGKAQVENRQKRLHFPQTTDSEPGTPVSPDPTFLLKGSHIATDTNREKSPANQP